MIQKAKQLTLAVYKVTDLFPQDEISVYQIRSLSNKITANLINEEDATQAIKKIIECLESVRAKGWTKTINFDILIKEYIKILSDLKKSGKAGFLLNSRQKKIVEYIQEHKAFTTKEILHMFPDISRRTLSRDLSQLCLMEAISRHGDKKSTYYTGV